MLIEKDEIIAFRTLLPDSVNGIKFCWMSGSYVNPAHRGKKLSQKLLESVFEDWDNFAVTNYTPISIHTHLSTQKFQLLRKRNGRIFYFYLRYNNHPLLSFLLRTITHIKVALIYKKINYTEIQSLDDECDKFLNNYPETFFNRKEQEIKWLLEYPWITSEKHDNFIYPFSYAGIKNKTGIVKIYSENKFEGFFIYKIIADKMQVPYFFIKKKCYAKAIKIISQIAVKNRVGILKILDTEIAKIFKNTAHLHAFSKKHSSNIYASFNFKDRENLQIFDGDGDNYFT